MNVSLEVYVINRVYILHYKQILGSILKFMRSSLFDFGDEIVATDHQIMYGYWLPKQILRTH